MEGKKVNTYMKTKQELLFEQQHKQNVKLTEDLAKMQFVYKKHITYIKKMEFKLRESARKVQRMKLEEAKLKQELKKRIKAEQKWQYPSEQYLNLDHT